MSRRPAFYVPPGAIRRFLNTYSKSDLMELVWDYALSSVGNSAEDPEENSARLEDIRERAEVIRGCLRG